MSNSILDLVNSQRNSIPNHNSNPFQTDPWTQQVKEIMRQIQSSPNKEAALMNLLQQNPNLQKISSLLKMGNGNLQQAAQILAQQKGKNLNDLIQELQR